MEVSIKQKLFYFFPVLLCFCFPFGSYGLSVLIALWVLVSFFNFDPAVFKQGLSNKILILFWGFFLFTVISALLSSNVKEAAFSVEIKLTFLFFPYLFFCFRWPPEILQRCVVSFVSGCFFACLYLIARAFFYAMNGQPDYFFYTLFSRFIHASYFAMYLIIAIVFVTLFYRDWFKTQKSVIYSSYFFVAIFIACIFLCSSKLGLISFFICMPILLLYKYRSRLNMKRMILFLVAACVLFVLIVKIFPEPFSRFGSLGITSIGNLDKTSSESTTVRILIWKEAIGVIRQHFLFGTGVGDANDMLYKAYEENELTGALQHKFNAHNQFFQTFIGMGVPGLFFILWMTFGFLFKGIKKKHFLLFIFSLVIILNFLVESMLQTSAGVLFFVFFCCFFERVSETDLKVEPAPVNKPAT